MSKLETFHKQFNNPTQSLKKGMLVFYMVSRWSIGQQDFYKAVVTRVTRSKVEIELENGETFEFDQNGTQLNHQSSWVFRKIVPYHENEQYVEECSTEAKRISEIRDARDYVLRAVDNMDNTDPRWLELHKLLNPAA